MIRTWPSYAAIDDRDCPQQTAAKARIGLMVPGDSTRRPKEFETFALGPAGAVLDRIEFDDQSADQALADIGSGRGRRGSLNEGLRLWTRHAVENYLSATAALTGRDGLQLSPYSREWAVQEHFGEESAGAVHEQCVTGRRYAAEGLRELRILRPGSVERRQTDRAETAAAARVLADGRDVYAAPWQKPYVMRRGVPRVEWLRVVEIGCLDGSTRVLFDDTAERARADYRQYAEEPLRAAIEGGEYRPGLHCADCKLVSLCPRVQQAPGLLGIDGPETRWRSWSVTAGREHAKCARRAYLAALWLPAAELAESAAIRRGRAVHASLEHQHRKVPVERCRSADAPEATDLLRIGDYVLEGTEAALAVQMIGDHAAVCPWRGPSPSAEAAVERSVFVFDQTANVLVTAKIDLLHARDGAWVLRETKTRRAASVVDPLGEYPQLALALVLAASGVTIDGLRIAKVELEFLGGSGPVIVPFYPEDRFTLLRARAIVRQHSEAWRMDTAFKHSVGKHCADCRVARWCADAPEERIGTEKPEGEE